MKQYPFSRKYRLNQQQDFQQLLTGNQKQVTPWWVVWFKKNEGDCARLGIIISKRNIATAVRRNILKRLVRESFRHHPAMLGTLDIVMMVRRAASKISKTQLRVELEQQWTRLNALHKS